MQRQLTSSQETATVVISWHSHQRSICCTLNQLLVKIQLQCHASRISRTRRRPDGPMSLDRPLFGLCLCGQSVNLGFDSLAKFLFGDFKVMFCLKPEPECRSGPEIER